MSDYDEVRDALAAAPDGAPGTYGGIHGSRADAVLKWHYRKTTELERERDDARHALARAALHLACLSDIEPGSAIDRARNTIARSLPPSHPLTATQETR